MKRTSRLTGFLMRVRIPDRNGSEIYETQRIVRTDVFSKLMITELCFAAHYRSQHEQPVRSKHLLR